MAKFIGAEYLVANMLIEQKKKGVDFVSFDALGKYGIYLQKQFIQADMDVILLTSRSQFLEVVYDFPDYFEYVLDESGRAIGISLKKSRNIDDLEYRFVCYLPESISEFLQNAIQQYV